MSINCGADMRQRTEFVDIAKGFAILAVVLAHIHFDVWGSDLFPTRAILAGGMWHVPVFFILAGFFIKEEKLANTFQFVKGKLKTVHLLTLYFYIPAVLLHNVFFSIGFYSSTVKYSGKYIMMYDTSVFLKNILAAVFFAGSEPIVGPLWFAYVLSLAFIGYALLTMLCRKLFKESNYEKMRFFVCLLLTVVSAILSNKYGLTISRCSNTVVVMLLLAIGQYMYQKKKMTFDSWLFFGMSLLLFWQNAVLSGHVHLDVNRYHDVFHLVCGNIAALYVICFISKKIVNTSIGAVLKMIGEKSFYIMALHIFFFKVFALIVRNWKPETTVDFLTPTVGGNVLLLLGYVAFGVFLPIVVAKVVDIIKGRVF